MYINRMHIIALSTFTKKNKKTEKRFILVNNDGFQKSSYKLFDLNFSIVFDHTF